MICTDARAPLPPSHQSDMTINSQNVKQRSPPWLQDEASSMWPIKCRTLPWHQYLQNMKDAQLIPSQVLSLGTGDLTLPIAKQPAHPANIILRVEAWKDGTSRTPISDDEGNSPIDWDEPDMIPSAAHTDRLPSSLPRVSWLSWSQHNRQIKAKIDKAQQFHGIFDLKALCPNEQRAI